MQKFKINRNSWHYKLNKNFYNDYYDMSGWEAKHHNFCSYWRATILRIVFGLIILSFLAFLLATLIAVTIAEPFAIAFTLLGIVSFIGFVAALITISEYINSRKKQSSEPKTLIGQRYAAYKNKICPLVEFDI
jgi:membrane protein implicated in regulation of membrane protease activity